MSVTAGLGLVAALFPRGFAKGTLRISTPSGTVQVVRIQPEAPRWLRRLVSIRYPGWSWRTDPPANAKGFKLSIEQKEFTLHGMRNQGSGTATGGQEDVSQTLINGVAVTPENAEAIFATVLPDAVSGKGFTISLGSAPAASPGPR